MASEAKTLGCGLGLFLILLGPACSDQGDAPRRGVPSEHPGVRFEKMGPTVTAAGVKAAIRDHVAVQSNRGTYAVEDAQLGKTWQLSLDSIHDPVRSFEREGQTIYFACADFRSVTGDDVLDVDFWLATGFGALEVTERKIHKVNREPRFRYDGIETREIE